MNLAIAACPERTQFPTLNIIPDREVTYFQCARLFGACLDMPDDEIVITSDIDMAVFGNQFTQPFPYGFEIYGSDLVPPNQFPICYIKAPVKYWRQAFNISTPGDGWEISTPFEYLEKMLGAIQCDNMRGNYWSRDQEHAFNKITESGIPLVNITRTNGHNQFAMRRMDRDGWDQGNPQEVIDAHLPRPGHDLKNFNKIKDLFHAVYPQDDLTWMVEYHEKYLSLL